MNKARKLVTLAAALPLAVALAACGGGSTPEPGGSGSPGGAPEAGTLTAWAWDPQFNVFALNEAAKVYEKDHPGFKLEVIETPWDDLQAKLTTLAQSRAYDELPDIFLMQNNAFQKNVINYPDLFTDYSSSSIDFSEFPDSVVAYSTVEGANYGVPFDNGTVISALRTDVLQEAGYTLADFTDITWTDFIAKGKEVLAKTGKPMISGQSNSADLIMMMLQSAGASLFDAEGKPTIAGNEALLASIKVYQELVEAKVLVEVNSWDEYIGAFVNDNVAGTINGVWILGSVQTATDQAGNWGVTNMPKLDGVPGATNYSANGGSSWAVSSNANVELAQDFLAQTFAGSTEFYDTILPSSGAIANWIPAGQSALYAEPQEFFGGQPVFADVLTFAANVPANNTGAYYYEGRDAVSAAITKILGGADPATALAEAQANVEFAMQ